MERIENVKRKNKNHVPIRMNYLFFAVFLLFSLLIIKLGLVQIVSGESYKNEVDRTEGISVKIGTPRGKIYDRNGHVIVDNKALNAITYTKTPTTTSQEMIKVAERLSKFISVDTDNITDRHLRDFWILKNPRKSTKLLSPKEINAINEAEDLSEEEKKEKVYKMQLDRISKEAINSISENELQVLSIFINMNTGYALSPQIIKNKNVSVEEISKVGENINKLPGVNVVTDWDRIYVHDNTLRSIFGNVSSAKDGLPKELKANYQAQGYSLNDRVGKSYLEYQYEDILQGQKKKIENTIKNGAVIESRIVSEGTRGKDLVLTIDMKLQKEIETIVEEELASQVKKSGQSPYLDRAFVVMMDPFTGEILSMVGKKYEKNNETGKYELNDYSLGTFTSSYEAGSAVKGATVLTGYMTNNLYPGERMIDEPIYIRGTKPKTSWFNKYQKIDMSDLLALERSSNSYMWKIAFRIGGDNYVPNEAVDFNSDSFDIIRNNFNEFGLGVPTGIDLPGEVSGFQGKEKKPGYLLDLVIGQYDTYTPMQLAQYVSTIANGGNRIRPHIMKEIRNPGESIDEAGTLLYESKPEILNRIDASPEEIHQVQKGFYRVTHGSQGTANNFKSAPYEAAAKSGTAEAFYKGPEMDKAVPTYNTSLVGYAPFDSPEVAISVLVPWSHQNHDPYINKTISKRVMDKYFELKKERYRNSRQSE